MSDWSEIRSLRQILLEMLKASGEYSQWDEAADYIVPDEGYWERNLSQGKCIHLTAAEVRVEISNLLAMSDEDYEKRAPFRPLSYWMSMSALELGHYARLRGLEGKERSESFPELGSNRYGMSGWDWFRLGGVEAISQAEAERILGFEFANGGRARDAARALIDLIQASAR